MVRHIARLGHHAEDAPIPNQKGLCGPDEAGYVVTLPFLTDEWNLADGLDALERAIRDFCDDLVTEGSRDVGLFVPWLKGMA